MKEMFRSVFDADYQGYEVFLNKVLKPLFGDKLEVLPVAEDNPTGVTDEAMKRARIKKIVRIANIAETFNRKPMEVFDITLEDRVDITRARVGIQQIIRRGLFIQTHAFMLFHAEHPAGENWRFSYALKLGTVGSMTDAKRYTYLFGQNMHCRTAIDRFAELANGEITDQKLLDAFNVEALSDEFFEEYRKKYAAFVKYITGKEFVKEKGKWVEKCGTPNAELMAQFRGDDKAVRDYVKKLMGRITFLHFLQRKGWMNWDINYMQHLFEKSDKKDNFLEAVLEPLFFGVLNTKAHYRTTLFKERGWDFALLAEWQDFPYLNGGLFEEDESDKLNVAFPESYFVDLFKFYARYNFTVDENDPDDAEVGVDPEMLGKIFENLLEDNKDKGAFYTPKEIVRYMCQESLTAYLVGKTGYDEELIRAFVVHPYDEVVNFNDKQQNHIYNCLERVKICDPAIGSGAFPMGLLNELVRCEEALLGEREDDHQCRSGLKKYIIQNNIYGVDIEKGAIDIARLRFWLSIIVDEKDPSPLPNLDYKIMQGNSLLESYKKVDLSHLLTDEGIGDEMLGGLFDNQDVIQDTREELAASLEAYFNCSDHEEKLRIQEDIRTVIKAQLSARNLNVDFGDIDIAANQEFFLWHTWFSDVFNRPSDCEKGFDIVIGNPPYGAKLSAVEKRQYRQLFPELQFKINTYACFVLHAFTLMHNTGYACFILPNTLLDNYFEDRLRKMILDNSLFELNDLSDRVFENAVVHSMIIRYGRGIRSEKVMVNISDTLSGEHFYIPTSFFLSQPNYTFDLRSYGNDVILTKLKINSEKLADILDIRQAIKTGDDNTYISHTPLDSTYKPILRGKDIQRFHFTSPGLYVQYGRHLACPRSKDIFEQPKILIREAGAKITATIDTENYYIMSSLYNGILKKPDYCIEYLLGLINSRLFQFIMDKLTFEKTKGAFTKAKIYHYYNLPVKRASYDEQSVIAELVKRIMSLTKQGLDYSKEEVLLDNAVFKLYGLSEQEVIEIVSK